MQSKMTIRVATRPSKLAVTQTRQTVALLQSANPDIAFEIVEFSTHGDRNHTSSLTSFGGTGVFVKELEQALLDKHADIAVHSLKDVPTGQPDGLLLASFPKREDHHDVFISRNGNTLEQMPPNFVLGTGSPRRVVQLKKIRPDAICKEIRGNIDTRLQKLYGGEYDAIVLAQAGLNRLATVPKSKELLRVEQCVPAPGQGCIAIECRGGDEAIIERIRKINDAETEQCILAERAFMGTVEGGCKFPLAAYAEKQNEQILLHAIIGDVRSEQFMKETADLSPYHIVIQAQLFATQFKQTCLQAGIDCTAEKQQQ